MNDKNDEVAAQELINDVNDILAGDSVFTANLIAKLNVGNNIASLINQSFNIILLIIMFLCFFSLSSSMSANIYEQTGEIGVLRSMGLTKRRVILLYFYESLILVFSACTLGIFVGIVVGYMFCL